MSMMCCSAPDCADSECIQLTEREMVVCETICGSVRPLAFSEVSRLVGLHQEILSRILKRLRKHGVIKKVGGAYRRVSQ